MQIAKIVPGVLALMAAGLLAACGSSSSTSSGGAAAAVRGTTSAASGAGGAAAPSALSAEAQSAATGDIPDSQVFLTFHDRTAGWSMQYPEGWAQRGAGSDVTFQSHNNVIHVLITHGAPPTGASVTAELARERASQPSLTYGTPSTITVQGAPVVKVSYSTISAPNPVTGKSVQLLVDRYVYPHAGRLATVDLGTAKGVDNVDAYKLISRSFRWL